MKNIFAFLISVFLTPFVYSQNHYIDISGGLNFSKIRGQQSLRFAPAAGLGYEFRFATILSLKTGVMYNQRGGQLTHTLWDNIAKEEYDRKFKLKTHYVSVPVLLGFYTTKETYGFGRFGIMVSYLIDATQETAVWKNSEYVFEVSNEKYLFNTFDAIGVIEGGMGSSINSRIIIEGTLGIQAGITNAINQSKAYSAIYNTNTNSIQLPNDPHFGFSMMMSLKYRFGAKSAE